MPAEYISYHCATSDGVRIPNSKDMVFLSPPDILPDNIANRILYSEGITLPKNLVKINEPTINLDLSTFSPDKNINLFFF